ncbi:Cysteine-rich repeat secretory protein 38 [Bienertia sinuspersici]
MLILIICQIFVYSFSYATAQRNFISNVCQDTFGNNTSNSAFEKNLNTLFSTMLSDTKIDYGFYNISVGQNFDVVHGIGLCRPDVSATDCRNCLSQGTRAIVLNCHNQKDAVGWYEKCMIRYSSRYIFRKMEIGPWYPLHSQVLYKIFGISKERFNRSASTLLTKLQAKAASGDSHRKFGAGEAKITSSFSIYALVQCTPDWKYPKLS